MENYICINGEKIAISEETADNLRERFCLQNRIKEIIKSLPLPSWKMVGDIEIAVINKRYHVKIPLPICNTEWTFWAFDCVEQIVKEYGKGAAPVHHHLKDFDNARWLYVEFK